MEAFACIPAEQPAQRPITYPVPLPGEGDKFPPSRQLVLASRRRTGLRGDPPGPRILVTNSAVSALEAAELVRPGSPCRLRALT